MKIKYILKGILCVILVVLAALLFGVVVEHLWNWLMPSIFGLRAITFWEAFGLLLLAKILFGGIHRHGGGWGRGRRAWKEKMEARFASMTPEERERFRAGMAGRRGCGFGRPVGPTAV